MRAFEIYLVGDHTFYVDGTFFDQAAFDCGTLKRRHSGQSVLVLNVPARHLAASAHKFNLICRWYVDAEFVLSIDEFVGLSLRHNAHHNQRGLEGIKVKSTGGHDIVANGYQHYRERW